MFYVLYSKCTSESQWGFVVACWILLQQLDRFWHFNNLCHNNIAPFRAKRLTLIWLTRFSGSVKKKALRLNKKKFKVQNKPYTARIKKVW